MKIVIVCRCYICMSFFLYIFELEVLPPRKCTRIFQAVI